MTEQNVKALPLMEAPRKRAHRPPQHWCDLDPEQRRQSIIDLGLPKFRADQISRQFFGRLAADPDQWTDLPAGLRDQVAETLFPPLLEEVSRISCDDGNTVKILWRLGGGDLVESVIMHYPARRTADGRESAARTTMCISSQAGCGMGCPFCATGQNGLQRNLSAAEIVLQAHRGAELLAAGEIGGKPLRISNIVFMGMGEPMANYRAVMQAVRTLHAPAPNGLGISARGITVSTVGLVPRMKQLADEGLPVTLALSLHAPDEELRNELVPITQRYGVAEVMDAAYAYAEKTRRRVSIEYILIKDMNDQGFRADLLADLIHARGNWNWAHVNLIPLNPTPGSVWTASRKEDEREFVRRLEAKGISVTVRDTRGQEIDGACGQLAAKGA